MRYRTESLVNPPARLSSRGSMETTCAWLASSYRSKALLVTVWRWPAWPGMLSETVAGPAGPPADYGICPAGPILQEEHASVNLVASHDCVVSAEGMALRTTWRMRPQRQQPPRLGAEGRPCQRSRSPRESAEAKPERTRNHDQILAREEAAGSVALRWSHYKEKLTNRAVS